MMLMVVILALAARQSGRHHPQLRRAPPSLFALTVIMMRLPLVQLKDGEVAAAQQRAIDAAGEARRAQEEAAALRRDSEALA